MIDKNFFLKRYEELGEKFKNIKLKQCLRVNTLKISHKKLIKRMNNLGVKLRKVPYLRDGFWVEEAEFSVGAITEFLLGYYYLQEAASQVAVQVLNPKEKDLVLDTCAAPGGKTTQISQLMNNKGKIIAMEKKKHRLTSLLSNLERMGVSNVDVFLGDARNCSKFNLLFDKILVDAPCSGNFVADKKWFEKRSVNDLKEMSRVQKQILKSCLKVLKKNGILVYSTCSLEPEENELNIQWLLENFNVKLEKTNVNVGDQGLTNVFGKKLNKEIKNCLRFWPWKMGTQGFFVAKIRKC